MAILKASLEVLVVAVPVVDKICFNNHNHILHCNIPILKKILLLHTVQGTSLQLSPLTTVLL